MLPPLIQTLTGMGPIVDIWTLLNDTGNITEMPERFTAVILPYFQKITSSPLMSGQLLTIIRQIA
jgi:hypothetical protein